MKQIESSLQNVRNKPGKQRITALAPAGHSSASLPVHSKTTGRQHRYPYSKILLRSDLKMLIFISGSFCISVCRHKSFKHKTYKLHLFKFPPQSSAVALSPVEENWLKIRLVLPVQIFLWRLSELRTSLSQMCFVVEFERTSQTSMKHKHCCIIAESGFYSDFFSQKRNASTSECLSSVNYCYSKWTRIILLWTEMIQIVYK